jgi:hypothetical protein
MGLNKKYTPATYASALLSHNVCAIEPYQGITTKIKHICNSCKNIWETQPRQILNNKECKHCLQLKLRKPLDKVKNDIKVYGWELVNDSEYKNSYTPLHLRHSCGDIIKSRLDTVMKTTNKRKRCSICTPYKLKKTWSNPIIKNNRTYSSLVEAECCEYLIHCFGENEIILQKSYIPGDRRTCDAYIIPLDIYVEISTICKEWYVERIYKKRQLVKNFIFVSSLDQLRSYFR